MADESALIDLVRRYEAAASVRSSEALRAVLALDDPRFSEFEDHIPHLMGGDGVEGVLQWIDTHPGFTYKVNYTVQRTALLADGVAYIAATNSWKSDHGEGTGRTTFVAVRSDDGVWRILHGHWSATPE